MRQTETGMTKCTTQKVTLKTDDRIAVGKRAAAKDDQGPSRIRLQFSGYIVASIGRQFLIDKTPRLEAWAAQVSTLRIVTAFGQTPLRKAEVVAACCSNPA